MRQCPTCGANVPEQATMCPDCGMDLATPAEAQHPATHAGAPAGSSQPPLVAPSRVPPAADPAHEPMIPPAPSTPEVAIPPATSADHAVVGAPDSTDRGETPPDPHATAHDSGSQSSSAASGASPTSTARLTVRRAGALTNDTFPLAGETIIGRFDVESGPIDVDLGPLPEAVYISRHHAQLRQDSSGQWFVKDLGSRNGTFVRTGSSGPFQRVSEEQAVNDGDEIALGNARFAFQVGA